MAWISWSRTWATRRTTTTSRKPLRCSSKNLRWKRMFLLLRADQRPTRRSTSACPSTRIVPICERFWTDIEPETCSPIDYPVSKRLSTLHRHGHLPQEEDGAIEFWRLKDDLRNKFEHSQQKCGTVELQEAEASNSSSPSSSRSFRTQSLWSFIQGQCIKSEQFLRVHCHNGCAINLHSITNSGLIPGGQILSKRQTVFFTSLDPMNKEHKDPDTVDLKAPRLAQYKRKVEECIKTLCIVST